MTSWYRRHRKSSFHAFTAVWARHQKHHHLHSGRMFETRQRVIIALHCVWRLNTHAAPGQNCVLTIAPRRVLVPDACQWKVMYSVIDFIDISFHTKTSRLIKQQILTKCSSRVCLKNVNFNDNTVVLLLKLLRGWRCVDDTSAPARCGSLERSQIWWATRSQNEDKMWKNLSVKYCYSRLSCIVIFVIFLVLIFADIKVKQFVANKVNR